MQAGVGDHQDLAAGVLGGDSAQRRQRAVGDFLGLLGAFGPAVLGQVAGPARLDLGES